MTKIHIVCVLPLHVSSLQSISAEQISASPRQDGRWPRWLVDRSQHQPWGSSWTSVPASYQHRNDMELYRELLQISQCSAAVSPGCRVGLSCCRLCSCTSSPRSAVQCTVGSSRPHNHSRYWAGIAPQEQGTTGNTAWETRVIDRYNIDR